MVEIDVVPERRRGLSALRLSLLMGLTVLLLIHDV